MWFCGQGCARKTVLALIAIIAGIFVIIKTLVGPALVSHQPGETPTTIPSIISPVAPTSLPVIPSKAIPPTTLVTPIATVVTVPTVTPFPSNGMEPLPYQITLRTDPTLFFSTYANDKLNAEGQFRQQIHFCLDPLNGSRAGLVLGTGHNQDPILGQSLAKRAMEILSAEIKDMFTSAVPMSPIEFKDFYSLTNDPYLNGVVNLEIFFFASPHIKSAQSILGTKCAPLLKSWCQGKANNQSLIVYNWDRFPFLEMNLDGQLYTIKPANGTPPKGDDRTIGCIMVAPGNHYWNAGQISGNFWVDAGKNPTPLQFCGPSSLPCPNGSPSPEVGSGTK